MPAQTEFLKSPEELDGQSQHAYWQRQNGRVALWKVKLDTLTALKLDGLDATEVARIKGDMTICRDEIARISTEMKRAEEVGSPGIARQQFKRPAPVKGLRA